MLRIASLWTTEAVSGDHRGPTRTDRRTPHASLGTHGSAHPRGITRLPIGLAPAHAQRVTGWADWDPLSGRPITTPRRCAYLRRASRRRAWPPTHARGRWACSPGPRCGSVPRPRSARSTAPARTGPTSTSGPSPTPRRPRRRRRTRSTNPTPPTGWAFVLGDIDADKVAISAKDADGQAVSAAQLGFVQAFNLCRFQPATPAPAPPRRRRADVGHRTRPSPATPAANDTVGATGWFEPDRVPVQPDLRSPVVRLPRLPDVVRQRRPYDQRHLCRRLRGWRILLGPGRHPRLVGPHGETLASTTPAAAAAPTRSASTPHNPATSSASSRPPVRHRRPCDPTASARRRTDAAPTSRYVRCPTTGLRSHDGSGTDPLGGVTVTLHLPGGGTSDPTGPDGPLPVRRQRGRQRLLRRIDSPTATTGVTPQAPSTSRTSPSRGRTST